MFCLGWTRNYALKDDNFMRTLRLILGDQLSLLMSSLEGYQANSDFVFMCEVWDETQYVKHHKKKIAFIFSAMRHFAKTLQQNKFRVIYTTLDDPKNTGSFKSEIQRIISEKNVERIIVSQPGEYRVLEDIQSWEKEFKIPVEIRDDSRFLCSSEEFEQWSKGRKQLRMEYFYREMRKKYGILMDGNEPIGGQWNYDAENRKFPKEELSVPAHYCAPPDKITRDVLTLVGDKFNDHFGDIEPFHFAVTREQALQALEQFIAERLYHFGDFQDAMIEGEPWMYHSHISFYLNIGLLSPLECVSAAESAFHQNKAPLNAVEGFIRQIIGWREYVRGIYWLNMPSYAEHNFFEATRKLPEFYWTADTKMNCIRQCVTETKENAYAHHIQRLMVLGNFALLAGISPEEVNEWFLIVYADAFEWVELPNVSGMILFADGGYLASKPYAAGGSYINRMSNYCKQCEYKVTKKNGEDACPFNYLYWDFLARNREKLSSNHRVGMMYKTYDRMSEEKKRSVTTDAIKFLDAL